MKEQIHEAFRKEGVFVTSPLNYIVYEAGFIAGMEYAQKSEHNIDYDECSQRKRAKVHHRLGGKQ